MVTPCGRANTQFSVAAAPLCILRSSHTSSGVVKGETEYRYTVEQEGCGEGEAL